jgi:hypothetical protein
LKNITRKETATNPTHEKSTTQSTGIILLLRGTAKLEFGKGGERLFDKGQSVPMSEKVERDGISFEFPLGLVIDTAASKAASA